MLAIVMRGKFKRIIQGVHIACLMLLTVVWSISLQAQQGGMNDQYSRYIEETESDLVSISADRSLIRKCFLPEYALDTCHLDQFKREVALDTTKTDIKKLLEHFVSGQYASSVRAKLLNFYRRNNYQAKWLHLTEPTSLFYKLKSIILQSSHYGLNPDDYDIIAMELEAASLYKNIYRRPTDIALLDLKISNKFFLFSSHLLQGRITEAGHRDNIWIKNRPNIDDVALLLNVNDTSDLQEAVESLHPKRAQYEKLLSALQTYRHMSAEVPEERFPRVDVENLIHPGDRHEAIPRLRQRLMLTDMDSSKNTNGDSLLYDRNMISAVEHFQARHGLKIDGIVGPNTLKHLNRSFEEKAGILLLNLERIRWWRGDYGNNYVIINIPEYQLKLYRKGKKKTEMKVVLGKQYTPTPVFSDTLEYLVFSPTWTVPFSIIKQEFIPKLKKDSLYYTRRNFKVYKHGEEIDPSLEDWTSNDINVYNYRFVQQPGERNALGLVKFIMPNSMSIYLHDTPADHLFMRNTRAFSHGCIRVEQPAKLADILLRDNRNWNKQKIKKAMRKDEPLQVFLDETYHVQIIYQTAWVDDEGVVQFREDIYRHDERQLRRLKKADLLM